MTKVLHCGDVMPGCSFEARGNSEEEVMSLAVEHAKSAHGVAEISDDVQAQVRGAIRDETESEEMAEVTIVEGLESSSKGSGEAASEEQPAEETPVDGEASVEEVMVAAASVAADEEPATEATMSELLGLHEGADEEEEGGRARAAGA